MISFTSGTTGRPKGATLTQRALAEASWAFVRILGTDRNDSTLVVVPMFHNTGFVDQFGHMLLLGARTDLLHKFRTAEAIAALIERPVSYLAAVPSIIQASHARRGRPGSLRSSPGAALRRLAHAGSMDRRAQRKWPRCVLSMDTG